MTTDEQAFGNMIDRLEGGVGRLLELATKESNGTPAFWAFLRMLFPIAESMGDLIFQNKTSNNLLPLFKNELSKFNSNYADTVALLILVYRHSLIHQDELRIIRYDNIEVRWAVLLNARDVHLKILNPSGPKIVIQFDITQFYNDLINLCKQKVNQDFGGKAGERYDQWRYLILNKNNKGGISSGIKGEAIKEIDSILNQNSKQKNPE